MNTEIKDILRRSIEVKQAILQNPVLLDTVEKVVQLCTECFEKDGKILFCGNGGSAADAQHLAAEFSGRFYSDRDPLFAEALHVNTSYITAVGNDYGYEYIYSRLVKAKARKGDILIGLSTSGNSENIIKAFEQAKEQEVTCIGFTGESGGKMKNLSDLLINIPSTDTPRIQESHITIGHIICELVEKSIFQ